MRIRCICLLLVVITTVQPSFAGVLRDFEKDATKPSPERSEPPCETAHSTSNSADDDLPLLLAEVLVAGVAYGGIESANRISGKGAEPRRTGDALLPMFRVDGSYQLAEDEVDAFDLRGEAGYGPVAVQARHTQYWERGSSDSMHTTQAHFLYRMSFGSNIEIDLGAGALFLHGINSTSGFSFTSPILIHPSENFGFEFRPAWANLNGNTIEDYDLAALIGGRGVSLKVGYRWFLSENQSLSGPQAGISVRW